MPDEEDKAPAEDAPDTPLHAHDESGEEDIEEDSGSETVGDTQEGGPPSEESGEYEQDDGDGEEE